MTEETVKVPSRVYIVQRLSNFDYTAAESLGEECVSITQNFFRLDSLDNVMNRMRKYIIGATVHDILLVSGHAVLNMLALQAWFERLPEVTLAVYNGDGGYTLHKLTRSEYK